MADLPKIKSKEQYVGELTDAFIARAKGLNDFTRQSVLFQFFEATGQTMFRGSASILQMIDAFSIDRAVGEALQTIARDKGVPILSAGPASGRVEIIDTSFQKVESRVYAGQPAPVAGSIEIFVADASSFDPTGGQLYIGRGSTNTEGPLTYVSAALESGGAYWKITLSTTTPTTKFHNIGERVTYAQGGKRIIPVNTTVKTTAGASEATEYRTTKEAFILDGETSVTDVPVVATEPGTRGNSFRGAISEVVGLSFSAVCFNNNPFTNGRDADDDNTLRARIKRFEQSKAKGTDTALIAASIGVVSEDDKEKVASASVVSLAGNAAALVFDNGSGYEPPINGIGVEQVVEEAIGGEKDLQLRQRPITPAQVKNNIDSPYPVADNTQLSVTIEGETTVHTFSSDDFSVQNNATAFEIASSINGNPNIHFNASTTDSGKRLILSPRDKSKNDIKVNLLEVLDANDALGFSRAVEFSARLYKNDNALFESGLLATINTRSKATWTTVTEGDTLRYIVDDTQEVEVSFSQSDFQDVDPTANFSVFEDIEVWAQVFNNKLPGVTSSVEGETISFTSNLGPNNRASLEFTGGQLLGKIFNLLSLSKAQGRGSDYELNKQTGQLTLTLPLQSGDKIAAGSPLTRGKVLTNPIASGPGSNGNIWFLIDGSVRLVENGLRPSTRITFTKLANGKLEINGTTPLSLPEGFLNVEKGDWLLIWHNEDKVITDPGEATLKKYSRFWRVEEVSEGHIRVDDSANTSVPVGVDGPHILPSDRFVIATSDAPIQKLSFSPSTLNDFINNIREQLEGVSVDLVGSRVRISTSTLDDEIGEVYVLAADDNGKSIGLTRNTAFKTIPSHLGFVNVLNSEASMPSFTHNQIDSIASNIINLNNPNLVELRGKIGSFVELLNSYDEPTFTEFPNSNYGKRALVTDFEDVIPGQDVTLLLPEYMQANTSPLKANDRFYLKQPFMFDDTDQLSLIVDGDATTKSYVLKVARRLEVGSHAGTTPNSHSPTQNSFSAIDLESSLDLEDVSSFGPGFLFDNFKVWRRSQVVLTDGNYNIRFKANDFGPAGDLFRVGFVYPQTIDQTELSHNIFPDDTISHAIRLPVSETRTPNWDSDSSFTVDVLSSSGGKDIVQYTWQVGTEPDFIAAGVVTDDIAMISGSADFLAANRTISAKVIGVTPTTFTIERPTGTAQTDMVEVSAFLNNGEQILITTSTPHNIQTGDRIGLYDTASPDGSLFPFNETFFAIVLNSTQFLVDTPSAAPGGNINTMTLVNYLVTVSATNHGLFEGNIIIIEGAGAPYDGIATVYSVINANTFTFARNVQNASTVTVGEYNFQSYADDTSTLKNISTFTHSGHLVTIETATAHSLSVGNVVRLQNIDIDDWDNLTAYSSEDIVEHSGLFYRALTATTPGSSPDITPSEWEIIDYELDKNFIVNTTPTSTSFTFYLPIQGNATGSGGEVLRQTASGSLARSLSNQAFLQFGAVETTAQEVVDYVSVNMASFISAELFGGSDGSETITQSTADEDAATDYLSGNISQIKTFDSSHEIILRVDVELKRGSVINVSGFTALSDYDGVYTITDVTEVSPGVYDCKSQSAIKAYATEVIVDSASFTGTTPYLTMIDGENYIDSTDLDASGASSMFTTKRAWSNVPDIGEELRLIAYTNEQLNRIWNKLIFTGLSNVVDISISNYGRGLQLSTERFGSSGSIRVIGGDANTKQAAVIGSANELNEKVGLVRIPYDLRSGMLPGQWLKFENQIRLPKNIGIEPTTVLQAISVTKQLTITGGPGSFQTIRTDGIDDEITAAVKVKIERQGSFVAIIAVDGTFNLSEREVREGDWLRIGSADLNSLANPVYDQGINYTPGNTVTFGTNVYRALQNNGPLSTIIEPGSNSAFWEPYSINSVNAGIFQIVRVFGDDTIYIENANVIEEITQVGPAASYLGGVGMAIYSYDSVMPGDQLVISGDVLGVANIGRYSVVDSPFPTSTIITVAEAINNTVPIILGTRSNLIRIEEENPIVLWKQIRTVGPGNNDLANVILDTPNLVNKISSSAGTGVTAQGKLNFIPGVYFGLDAYKYFGGLHRQLNRIIYGDPKDTANFPGVRASGTDIDIRNAIIKRIAVSVAVRARTGVPFDEVRERVRAAIAGYINRLGVGEQVSMSRIISAASTINGVYSVVITEPIFSVTNDLIPVGSQEKAFVINPAQDIVISILGT